MSSVGAVVRSYANLIDAIRDRRVELQLSQRELDAATGLADGYTSKIETGPRSRRRYNRALGRESLQLFLDALGLELVVRESADATRRKASAALVTLGKRPGTVKGKAAPCWLCGVARADCSDAVGCIGRLAQCGTVRCGQ